KDWAGTAIAQLVPPVIPAAILPVMEHTFGYNTFLGTPLIPSNLEDASNYMQYTPATSETAKAITRLLGPPNENLIDVSPIVVDNYVRQWTGGIGGAVLRALDATIGEKDRLPDMANNPFIGSFFVRHPGTSAQPITDFYDAMDGITAKHKDL